VQDIDLVGGLSAYITTGQVALSTDTTQIDTSDWNTIQSSTVTQTTPGSSAIYHAVSFDDRVTWKAFVSSAWRTIAYNNGGTWQYHNGSSLVNATVNTVWGAFDQAWAVSGNRWTKTAVDAICVPAKDFTKKIMEERRKGVLPSELNFKHDTELDEIYLNTTTGRARRPLSVVKNAQSKLTAEHIEDLKSGKIKWDKLVKDGVIEYLDAAEEEEALQRIRPSEQQFGRGGDEHHQQQATRQQAQ